VVSDEKQKCDGVPERDGGFVMLVRSGTACRAPTAETATEKGTMSLSVPSNAIVPRRCRWHR